MSTMLLNRANDLLPRYMWMGNWKASFLQKGSRSSRTGSKKTRCYVAIPPKSGWPGGAPESNGLRGRSSK